MSKVRMSRKLQAVMVVAIVACSTASLIAGYYIGYNVGFKAGYAEAPVPVRIGHLVADIHQIQFFIAFSRGFYEQEGIKPIRLEYGSGPLEMMALAAGDLDAGYVGSVPALMSKSKGIDLVIIASANLEGSAIVARPDVKRVEDLNRRRVGTPGIGTIQDCLLYMVEKKFGITVSRSHMKVSDLPLALEKGEIDAFIAWEPFCAEIVVKGIGHIIHTSRDILPNHQCCVLYVSGKMFRENPSLVKKLIKVHIKAAKFAIERPGDAMKIFADMTGKPLEVVRESWKRMIWDYHVNIESMRVFVPYLIEQGKVQSDDVPDLDKFLSEAVDKKVLAEVEAAG